MGAIIHFRDGAENAVGSQDGRREFDGTMRRLISYRLVVLADTRRRLETGCQKGVSVRTIDSGCLLQEVDLTPVRDRQEVNLVCATSKLV